MMILAILILIVVGVLMAAVLVSEFIISKDRLGNLMALVVAGLIYAAGYWAVTTVLK